ncbi:MAG TPA: primosomal protein N' [Myxococcota bacterium]|nr:primosomal protein N' [Myxococcota bacterium]
MSDSWVKVALARPLADALTYAVPRGLTVVVGHVVLVPLGPVAETGYVVEVLDAPDLDPARIRPIRRLIDPLPAFDAAQLDFFRWIADYYMAPLGAVIKTAVPGEVRARVVRVLEPTEAGVEALTARQIDGEEAAVLREIIARPGLTRRALTRRLASEIEDEVVEHAVAALLRDGRARWDEREDKETQAKAATVALPGSIDAALARVPRAGPRQKALLRAVAAADGPVDVAALVAAHGVSAREVITRLVAAGALVRGERELRDALEEAPALGARVALALNGDQRSALTALTAPGAAGAFLLFGVTGSGKTEVFLGAAQAALERGQQVCVLVPEIGLTPQLVGRFKARFGPDVAVLHSGLTGRDRVAHWRRVRSGEARVLVGARSALFAPFRSLGLVVVDEEHDDSYKQEDGVRYNARDLAVVLGRRAGCPVVLASATPSLESWVNARSGRYTLLRLPRRATPRPVPAIELVDMTQVPRPAEGPRPLFAPPCVQALRETFDRGGQAVVLYNRRGYATLVECTSCGGSYECPNCGVSMTLHQRAGVVACHYCGLTRPAQVACPACGQPTLEELGKGTERVEEELTRLFPDVPIARMDADTTAVRGSLHAMLDDFRAGRTRLLVGTQIIAKGHDFPGVHTAIVVSVDQGFRMPDFRASERTYALLVQLAGRAGRGDVPGRVLVQTWKPDHYALTELGSVEGFLEREVRLRRTLRYPPVARLALVRLDGVDRPTVQAAARSLAADLRREPAPGVDVLGPALAALPKLVGRWRYQLILRGEQIAAFRGWLTRVRARIEGAAGGGVRVSVDVDPRSLM